MSHSPIFDPATDHQSLLQLHRRRRPARFRRSWKLSPAHLRPRPDQWCTFRYLLHSLRLTSRAPADLSSTRSTPISPRSVPTPHQHAPTRPSSLPRPRSSNLAHLTSTPLETQRVPPRSLIPFCSPTPRSRPPLARETRRKSSSVLIPQRYADGLAPTNTV